MDNARQSALFAAAFLAVWFVSVRCQPAMAEDVFLHRPYAGENLAYQSLVAPGDEFTNDATWGSTDVKTTDLNWTQRIAQMAKGRTQLEGGCSYLRGSSGGSNWTQFAIPDMLLRFGLTDRWELRLGWPGYVTGDTDAPATGNGFSGTLDPNVGLVYDLWGQQGGLPQTAVHAAIPVRLTGNPFALNSLQPLTELMYAWQTSERTTITGRSGFAIFDSAGDNYCSVSLVNWGSLNSMNP